MSENDAPDSEMQQLFRRLGRYDALRLDDATVDRLLAGTTSADDAPPAYRRVAQVITLAAGAETRLELDGEREAVAAIAARLEEQRVAEPPVLRPKKRRRFAQAGIASLAGGAILFGGLAAAGALPGPAQRVAADLLDTVGVSVPDPNGNTVDHPDEVRKSDSPEQESGPRGEESTTSEITNSGVTNSGVPNSGVPTTTSPSPTAGADAGAAPSTVASDGQGRTGSNVGASGNAPVDTPPSDTPPVDTLPVDTPPVDTLPVDTPPVDTPPVDTPPVEVPNLGGTGTADIASDGQSTTGTERANEASDGRSSAGSANTATPPTSQRP